MSTKYQFGPRIGAGGMADVYKGFDTTLHREVAIKVMKATMVDNTRFVERFGREARVNARLRHHNIVQVYELGEVEGRPMLVMELLQGETLKERIARAPLTEEQAVGITRQVLQALAFAQEQEKVVHRDIKPGNVFLSTGWDQPGAPDGAVKLMDFGIASAATEIQVTYGGERFGTPDYMSPEQADGKPTDFATDTYAVGVMLYEMLCGQTPFKADNPLVVMKMHVTTPPPDLPPTVSPHLRNVVMTALAKDPAQRYPNARVMESALLGRASGNWPQVQKGMGGGATQPMRQQGGTNPGGNQPSGNYPSGNYPSGTFPPTAPPPSKGPNIALIAGGTVFLAALGGLGFLLAKPNPGNVAGALPTPVSTGISSNKPSASPKPATPKPAASVVAVKATPAATPVVKTAKPEIDPGPRITRTSSGSAGRRTPVRDRPSRDRSDDGPRVKPNRSSGGDSKPSGSTGPKPTGTKKPSGGSGSSGSSSAGDPNMDF